MQVTDVSEVTDKTDRDQSVSCEDEGKKMNVTMAEVHRYTNTSCSNQDGEYQRKSMHKETD